MATMLDTIPCERCDIQINLQDWAEHVRNCLDGRNKRTKRDNRDTMNDESETERIPCEFCKDLISLDDWESHSEKCAESHRIRIESLRNGFDIAPAETFIPCEYCDTLFSVHELEWHSKQCVGDHQRRNTAESENISDEPVLIPCEYCSAQVSADEWKRHTSRCAKTGTQRMNNLIEYQGAELSNELIPCEYCDKSYSMQEIETHQHKCRTKQTSANFRPDAPTDTVSGNFFPLPENWDPTSKKNLTRYTLHPGTEEYQFVADRFLKTLPTNRIKRIERIQNRRWYRQYDAHKEDFIERYGRSTEQWLFHGCRKSESAEAIIPDCFNRSHAVNCAAGQGIYFATDAMISHGYTHPDSRKQRYMFMARVLVGQTAAGDPSMRVCPPGFDTTGGGTVFVTYHDAQAYGQYLIIYK